MRLLLLASLLSTVSFGADDPKLQAFSGRVEKYAKIRAESISKVPRLPKQAKPEEIERHEKALVDVIRTARPNAKQGEFFTPDTLPLFAKILKNNLAGPENQTARDTAKQGNPKFDKEIGQTDPVMQVNAVYPKTAPLSTVPPDLLIQLPPLPKDIEYRFVGRTLVLWDNLSRLIIDYIKEATPVL